MAIRKETAIRHLSYEEMDMMLREVAEQIRSKGIKVASIAPKEQEDYVGAAILASFLGVKVGPGDKVFGLYSDHMVDFCLFHKIYENDIYNKDTKCYADTVYVDPEMKHTRITLPWMK